MKKKSAYIRNLAVSPAYQGKGLGKLLVFLIRKEYEILHLSLVTRRINESGIGFYEHIGFAESEYQHKGLDPKKYVGFEWHFQ